MASGCYVRQETDRQTDRETETQRETYRERHRERDRDTDTQTHRHTHRQTQREIERGTEIDRETDRERERERATQGQMALGHLSPSSFCAPRGSLFSTALVSTRRGKKQVPACRKMPLEFQGCELDQRHIPGKAWCRVPAGGRQWVGICGACCPSQRDSSQQLMAGSAEASAASSSVLCCFLLQAGTIYL